MAYIKLLIVSALVALAATTEVNQCPGANFENLSQNIQIEGCSTQPCKLRIGTSPKFTITFTPENDLDNLVTNVSANVAGVPMPFIGVDGSDARSQLLNEDEEEVSKYPLDAGKDYKYQKSLPIQSYYPKGTYGVHWALTSGGKDVICFEVQVEIA